MSNIINVILLQFMTGGPIRYSVGGGRRGGGGAEGRVTDRDTRQMTKTIIHSGLMISY